MRKFNTIKGLSDARRLPRLGKIRLGIKKISPKTKKEYPSETDYFVCPEEVEKIYGKTPRELDVMLPVEDIGITFPQAYEYYGSGKGLKCIGDGETAERKDDGGFWQERDCPCELFEEGKCSQRAHLSVILPEVSVGGIYQIDTSSYNSIIDLNSSIDYVKAMVGRVAMVPLKLVRQPTDTHHEGKKQTHYTLRLEFPGNLETINHLKANTNRILGVSLTLPEPDRVNPEDDGEPAVVEVIDEADKKLIPSQTEPVAKALNGAFNEDQLMEQIKAAESVDDINDIMTATNSLEDKELAKKIRKAAGAKVKEITGGK